MKDDTIIRQLAIDKFAAYIYQAFKDFYRIGLHRKTLTPEQCRRVARNVLAEVPSAQPKSYREGYQAGFKDAQPERKRGKWEFYEDRAPVWDIAGEKTWARAYKCSECGFVHSVIEDFGRYGFCPNCVADMREASK